MIEMESAIGKQVFIQLKHKMYICGKYQGQLMPAMVSPGGDADPILVTTDYMMGKLSKEGEQFVVTYTTPEKIRMRVLLNPEDAIAVFYEDTSNIEVVSTLPTEA